MKTFLFFMLFIFPSFASLLLAQENDNYKTIALSFNFNGLNLSNYYGGVGGRLWVSKSTVLNASIGGSISEREYLESDEIDNGLEKNKYLILGIGMENHFPMSDDLSPYLSTRLSFGYRNQYYRYYNSSNEQEDVTYSYNLGFGLGVEYWIFERISLSGQHLFNAYYEAGHRNTNGSATIVQEIKGYGLAFGTTSLILSIYF